MNWSCTYTNPVRPRIASIRLAFPPACQIPGTCLLFSASVWWEFANTVCSLPCSLAPFFLLPSCLGHLELHGFLHASGKQNTLVSQASTLDLPSLGNMLPSDMCIACSVMSLMLFLVITAAVLP